MTRPILAYLVIVALGAWVFVAFEDVKQSGDLVRGAVVAATRLLGSGPAPLALLAFVLIPAMVATSALVHRFEARSRAGRAVVGAVSWAAWCLFVAITLVVVSRVVLVPDVLIDALAWLSAAGTGFSLLAFDGHERRPGNALALLALAVTAFVIVGSVLMAGRWGGPA